MKRPFTIGERVFDSHDNRWGTILLIAGADHDDCVDEDCVITLKPDDSGGEDETLAAALYKIAPGKTFRGSPVCWEHCSEIDYPYYCPDEDENCYNFELDDETAGKKKFTFRFHTHGWTDITVEAEDEEEARELADDKYNNGEYDDDASDFENITDKEDDD